ncbi:hypothetical protein [Amycolatopsis sp. MEPSY49]|uniref:hypothetical protein n=1 Tax=Amycolatopsis sp. MEPSY49 TaxID=3151600 RepID=UPI003EF8A9A6
MTAITSAGLLFSFAGVMTPAVISGEARNPRRDAPLGMFAATGGRSGLQVAIRRSPSCLLSGQRPAELLAPEALVPAPLG